MGKRETCLLCGVLTDQLFCSNCSDKGWGQYRELQTFLQEHPGATIIEVCRETSLPFSFVKGLIEGGYLNAGVSGDSTITESPGFHSGFKKY
ncbi:MAG: hypothetical protein CVU89_01320 [Firmicutes bacterium HGW-Firmicutes-14]|jgi:hypothetical protein|nr:MAG: hypothetical protein CVU89_01320 [Firmicutes bacterium HGW-Firmicutes-14]